jgi:hypothetical protein
MPLAKRLQAEGDNHAASQALARHLQEEANYAAAKQLQEEEDHASSSMSSESLALALRLQKEDMELASHLGTPDATDGSPYLSALETQMREVRMSCEGPPTAPLVVKIQPGADLSSGC